MISWFRQWQVIVEGGGYKVHLRWLSPHGELKVNDVSIDRVEGISEMNLALLKQRGALMLGETDGVSIVASSEENYSLTKDSVIKNTLLKSFVKKRLFG